MGTILYINHGKAMELVFSHCEAANRLDQYATIFKAIRDDGLQFRLKNGNILMRGISEKDRKVKRIRYVIAVDMETEIDPDVEIMVLEKDVEKENALKEYFNKSI